MDLTAFRRRPSSPSMPINRRYGKSPMIKGPRLASSTITGILATSLIALPLLVLFSIVSRGGKPSGGASGFAEASRVLERGSRNVTVSVQGNGGHSSTGGEFSASDDDDVSAPPHHHWDELLGGLLAAGFDKRSCLSRYQSASYRKKASSSSSSLHKPSSYLISRLRNYEAFHKRCGPNSESYKKTLEALNSREGQTTEGSTECKYVVWISFSGLGNRILTLASAFLYALLTDRVLLIDQGKDMVDLFCEPFPGESWLLPRNFPLTKQFDSFSQRSPNCHGNLLKNNHKMSSSKELLLPPPYLYLHLGHDYDDHDKLFFCDEEQMAMRDVPWLIMKTDNYFVPSLFLMPSFEQELGNLFPEKHTVFHHLGRYLFHPSNQVWGLITRYYDSYLARADERIGLQIRTFDSGDGPFPYVMDQILACTQREKLLPQVDKRGGGGGTVTTPIKQQRLKSVLVTSLSAGYSDNLRNMYWMHPTVSGDIVVGVHQPSQEGHQQTEKPLHNRKAWAEMYLLSLSDVLVTSPWSTFGYVAQGLAGLRPWILYKPENRTAPDPPCVRAMSMEPCFHAPPFYDCKAKKGIDTGVLLPHVRHCEDMTWGLKVVDQGQKGFIA